MLLVPVAFCRAPGRARFLACQWALGLRFLREGARWLEQRGGRYGLYRDAADDGCPPAYAVG